MAWAERPSELDAPGHTPRGDELETVLDRLENSGIVASWKTTPAILGFTTETDVLSNSWTPPVVGCYRLEATIPFDGSAVGTDCKARLLLAGGEIDSVIGQTPGGSFVDKLHVFGTIDIISLAAVTVKTTIARVSGVATCNCRIAEARIEIFFAGGTGVRA